MFMLIEVIIWFRCDICYVYCCDGDASDSVSTQEERASVVIKNIMGSRQYIPLKTEMLLDL